MALAERAVQTRVRAGGGAPVVTTDVTMHYLAMGRAGPIRTRAHVLRSAGEATLVRVELRDFGADDRLLAVATATARPSAALG
jgi:acyl-coenzyme A thioesterase PaaI-like protein